MNITPIEYIQPNTIIDVREVLRDICFQYEKSYAWMVIIILAYFVVVDHSPFIKGKIKDYANDIMGMLALAASGYIVMTLYYQNIFNKLQSVILAFIILWFLVRIVTRVRIWVKGYFKSKKVR